MIVLLRALALAVVLVGAVTSASAADKAFKRADLADAAIKLEAQIRGENAGVNKPVTVLRSEAEAAARRGDTRAALQSLGQLVSSSPDDGGNWLRLAQTILQISATPAEQTFLLERASTAAYLAYQRAGNAGAEAEALAVLGRAMRLRKLWRPALTAYGLSLDLREVGDVRKAYEDIRAEHGFRLMDYTIEFRRRIAARLFPVFRSAGQAPRFQSLRRHGGK